MRHFQSQEIFERTHENSLLRVGPCRRGVKMVVMKRTKVLTLRAGFEPAREDPIGFQVQRLNHSAIAAPPFLDTLTIL